MTTPSKSAHPWLTITSHKFSDGDPHPMPAVRIGCGQCDTVEHLRLTGPFNGYHANERFKKKGWETGRRVRCPECARLNRHHRREPPGESALAEGLRVVAGRDYPPGEIAARHRVGGLPIASLESPADRFAHRLEREAPREQMTAVARVVSPEPLKIRAVAERPTLTAKGSPMSSPLPTPRTLTPDERQKVRRLLDEHFDDQAGRYLDGYSDQRIGDETSLPFASVAAYREVAYGPIKHDDELDATLAAIAALERGLANTEKENGARIRGYRSEIEQWKTTAERDCRALIGQGHEDLKRSLKEIEQAIEAAFGQVRAQIQEWRDRTVVAARSRGLKT